MITLSRGVKKPESGDLGNVVFPAMEANCVILNDHNHDGVTSAPLSGNAISANVILALAPGWVAVAGKDGTYRQLITITGGLTLSNSILKIEHLGNHSVIFPTIEGVSNTQFYIYTNDNTIEYRVILK